MKVNRRRFDRVASQILVWAGDEPLEIKYSGFRFLVPPMNETAKLGPGSKYKYESARDAKGELVPGSVLVTDRKNESAEGGIDRYFDVNTCCEYLSRDKPELFDKGFAIVDDVNEIRPTLQELRPDYERSQDQRAQAILATEMERQKKYQDAGKIAPERENPEVVQWALNHLARRKKAMKPAVGLEEIQSVLEGRFDLPADVPEPKPESKVPAIVADEKPTGAGLFAECKDWGLSLTKREMEAILTDDREQIDYIRAKLDMKKQEAAADPA